MTATGAEPSGLRALAVAIAEEAGALACAARAVGRDALEAAAEHKSSSTDLVTSADRANEQLIRRRINEARPDDAVLGEEGGAAGGSSGLVWVVDPIDGTTNFVYHFASFAVSIAVAETLPAAAAPGSDALGRLLGTGRLLAGVVHDPVRGETFSAAAGGGAFLGERRLRLERAPVGIERALIATGFDYDAEARRNQALLLQAVLPAIRDLRRGGVASLDLCSVAAGRIDAYYESGVNSWDVAAGVLIATEAGARCLALEDLLHGPPTVLAGAEPLIGELEALLRRAAGGSSAPGVARAGGRAGALGGAGCFDGSGIEDEFDVVVEIPKGQRNKYEVDHDTGRIRLDRTLFTATRYPADYGYVEGTLGLDGDPLDALALLEEPTFPGCVVRCRAIGIFQMTDEEGPDAKIVSVPAGDPRYRHLQDLGDLPLFDRDTIEHFFMEYKALEPGKRV
ncbi:MAG TPA: inositol monophosphatase family protein, partial [Acidimicrobiales bacterium]|nr:inositol monophosphatase family protein [Acidimicrobiales bacterium]